MSLYGAVSNGVREFQAHQRLHVERATTLANEPFNPADQEELTQRALRLDREKQYIDFAQGIVEEVLNNLTKIQP